MKNNLYYFFVLVCFSIILMNCGPSRITMKEPQFNDVQISGLNKDSEIFEVTDVYNGGLSMDDEYWIVVKQNKSFNIGKINLNTGVVTNLKQLAAYSREKPLYWTILEENKMGFGKKLLGICMGSILGRGTTEDYSFIAEKHFDNNEQHRVHIEYSLLEKKTSTWDKEETITQWSGRLKFLVDGNVIEPLFVHGYLDVFSPSSNIISTRYFTIGDKQYISIQPKTPIGSEDIAFIYFDLDKEKSSWGAEFSLPKYYIGCGISRDKNYLGIIMGQKGDYILRKYEINKLITNVKAIKK